MAVAKIHVYKSRKDKLWRFRHVSRNGKIPGQQGYPSRYAAIRAAAQYRNSAQTAKIVTVIDGEELAYE